jgi:hypothetical protein
MRNRGVGGEVTCCWGGYVDMDQSIGWWAMLAGDGLWHGGPQLVGDAAVDHSGPNPAMTWLIWAAGPQVATSAGV